MCRTWPCASWDCHEASTSVQWLLLTLSVQWLLMTLSRLRASGPAVVALLVTYSCLWNYCGSSTKTCLRSRRGPRQNAFSHLPHANILHVYNIHMYTATEVAPPGSKAKAPLAAASGRFVDFLAGRAASQRHFRLNDPSAGIACSLTRLSCCATSGRLRSTR